MADPKSPGNGDTRPTATPPLKAPTDYLAGYPAARAMDAATADLYIAHTWTGDPQADNVVELLADMPPQAARGSTAAV